MLSRLNIFLDGCPAYYLQDSSRSSWKYWKTRAGANITIRIKEWNKTVSFFIEDDGKGFDANQVFNRDTMEGDWVGNLARTGTNVASTFDLRSEEGRGTKITFCIPIEKEPIHMDKYRILIAMIMPYFEKGKKILAEKKRDRSCREAADVVKF